MLSFKMLFYLGIITLFLQITLSAPVGEPGEQPKEETKKQGCHGCGKNHNEKTGQQNSVAAKQTESVRAPSPPKKVTPIQPKEEPKKTGCSGCGHNHAKTEKQAEPVRAPSPPKKVTPVQPKEEPKKSGCSGCGHHHATTNEQSERRGRSPTKRSQSPGAAGRSSSRGGTRSPKERSTSPAGRVSVVKATSNSRASRSPSRSDALPRTNSQVEVAAM